MPEIHLNRGLTESLSEERTKNWKRLYKSIEVKGGYISEEAYTTEEEAVEAAKERTKRLEQDSYVLLVPEGVYIVLSWIKRWDYFPDSYEQLTVFEFKNTAEQKPWPTPKNKTDEVTKIVNEGDRLLIYGDQPNYYIVARPDEEIKVGDRFEYQPEGVNFGWFKRNLSADSKED